MKIPKTPLVGIGPFNAMPWIRKGVDVVVDKVKNTIRRSNEAQKLYQEDRDRGVKFNRYESVSDTLKRHGVK